MKLSVNLEEIEGMLDTFCDGNVMRVEIMSRLANAEVMSRALERVGAEHLEADLEAHRVEHLEPISRSVRRLEAYAWQPLDGCATVE